MAGKGPSILVVADDWNERVLIAATLREAGFAAVGAAERGAALAASRGDLFAAAVIAVAHDEAVALARDLRRWQPGLPALLVLDAAAMDRANDEDCVTIIKRPFDARQLLGCVFELVLRDDETQGALRHSHAAELGIAAATLACLCNRRTIAAAAGAGRLAQDLTRQIGDMRSTYRRLAARGGSLAIATGGLAG
jgi:DNA-binding NtrC family response regulator